MTLNDLFKNTTYDDTLFSAEAKSAIESRIFMKSVRGSEVPYVTCAIRDKEIKLTPEEAVRQLYIYKLMNDYGYATSRIQLETPIHFGREVKRADIAIMDKDRPMVPYIIVELKKPKLTDGKEQLKSYCNATGAPIGVWTNGEQISCYNRKDPNFFEEISDIPKATQKLSDIINEKFTYEDLKRKDKISTQKTSLRALIKEMEDEVLASAGVDDGYRFRSRLEARWAVFFNNIGLEYEYEMEGFDMKNVLTCLTSISHLLTDGLRSKASR